MSEGACGALAGDRKPERHAWGLPAPLHPAGAPPPEAVPACPQVCDAGAVTSAPGAGRAQQTHKERASGRLQLSRFAESHVP